MAIFVNRALLLVRCEPVRKDAFASFERAPVRTTSPLEIAPSAGVDGGDYR